MADDATRATRVVREAEPNDLAARVMFSDRMASDTGVGISPAVRARMFEPFYAEIERRDPALARRVIFLTGGAFSPAAQQFLDRVPDRWFEKPCDLEDLRAAIRATIPAEKCDEEYDKLTP